MRHRCAVCDIRGVPTATTRVRRETWEQARAFRPVGWTISAFIRHALHEYLEKRA